MAPATGSDTFKPSTNPLKPFAGTKSDNVDHLSESYLSEKAQIIKDFTHGVASSLWLGDKRGSSASRLNIQPAMRCIKYLVLIILLAIAYLCFSKNVQEPESSDQDMCAINIMKF